MEKGADYRIVKLEKGPLQRFKNQNLLLKKYGEIGLQIYKAITGKRTATELRRDLGVEEGLFAEVLDFMQDAGMVELQPTGAARREAGVSVPEEEIRPGEEKPGRALEEIPPGEELSEEAGEEKPPLEEQPRRKRRTLEEAKPEEEARPESEEELRPEEEAALPEEAAQQGKPARRKKEAAFGPAVFDEIRPIEFGEEEKPARRKKEEEEKEAEGAAPAGEEAQPGEEAKPEEEAPPESEEEIRPEEEAYPVSETAEAASGGGRRAGEEGGGLSPVEKIISDKYGDIGLRVYTLIDGQRTAEEIMRDTGLTEAKLVEILDFMDAQGIIKLDYPKGQPPAGGAAAAAEEKKEGFTPLIEGDQPEETGPVPSPLEIPVKAPMDIVKSVQMKAGIMLKFGDKGGRILSQIDGKNDILDLAMNLGLPLYTVADVLKYLMESGLVIMKAVQRADVRKKYGDDGYAVYKKYGKEGLMLYELIGKDLTIKQMADHITRDKQKVIDMFVFIHKVLGIELPIDRDLLAKQLGV